MITLEQALKRISDEFPEVNSDNIEEVFDDAMRSALVMSLILRKLESIENMIQGRGDLRVDTEVDLGELTPNYRCKLCNQRTVAPDLLRRVHVMYLAGAKGYAIKSAFKPEFDRRDLECPSGQSFARHCKLHVDLQQLQHIREQGHDTN
jgi:hypothetical protein